MENGAPIELLEFTDPNHPGRRQQSKMLIQTPSAARFGMTKSVGVTPLSVLSLTKSMI